MATDKKPFLSITIPTYNRKSILESTLVPLVKQIETFDLYDEIEIVISDNCSTDNTDAFIADVKKNTNVTIVYNKNEKNLGVIKNILKLVEMTSGEFWMFYGDDDLVPDNTLPALLKELHANSGYPAFLYKQYEQHKPGQVVPGKMHALNIREFAKKYFYYVGNAGIFAINTALLKAACKINPASLLNTCWPQTNLFFLAVDLSAENKNIFLSDLITSDSTIDGLVYHNSYYIFETMLYSQLRSAIAIEAVIKSDFTDNALKSFVFAGNYEAFKKSIVTNYLFYDFDNEKADFNNSIKEALKVIPEKYRFYIEDIYKATRYPFFQKIKYYREYFADRMKRNFDVGFITKLKILSPFGFRDSINVKLNEKKTFYKSKGKSIITADNGYF